MIKIRGYFLIFLLWSSCAFSQTKLKNDSIIYYPFDTEFINSINASVNNSKVTGNFRLDSGTSNKNGITIDSTFFFNHVDTTGLKRVKPSFKMYYWQMYYEGDISISIGDYSFYVNRLTVNNQRRLRSGNKNGIWAGVLDATPFLEKYVVIDYDNKKIAFVDTISIDSSYVGIPLYPPRVSSRVYNSERYVKVEGLETKTGKKCDGSFLFDTGCGITGLMLKPDYAQKLKKGINEETIGDDIRWYVDSLWIGEICINDAPLRKVKKGAFDNMVMLKGGDGLLGYSILRRFHIITDYKHNMLYLKPNKWYYERLKKKR